MSWWWQLTIRWWGSNSESLRKALYHFIVIIPISSLINIKIELLVFDCNNYTKIALACLKSNPQSIRFQIMDVQREFDKDGFAMKTNRPTNPPTEYIVNFSNILIDNVDIFLEYFRTEPLLNK